MEEHLRTGPCATESLRYRTDFPATNLVSVSSDRKKVLATAVSLEATAKVVTSPVSVTGAEAMRELD